MTAASTQELFESSGGGAPLFFNKDSLIGARIVGTVVKSEPIQARDYEDGTPKVWNDGSPQQQLVVTLQTTLRSPAIEDDDGMRRVFIRWWGTDKRNLESAIYATGDKWLKDGATLAATFTGFGEQKDKKLNPPKVFEFEYTSPPSATQAMMTKPTNGSTDAVAEAAQVQAAARAAAQAAHVAATAPAAPPPTAGMDRAAQVAQVKQLAAEGLDAELIAATIPELSLRVIQAILNIKA